MGFGQSSLLPAVQYEPCIDVMDQAGRRFEAMLMLGGYIPCIKGTVSASNVLDATGDDLLGHHFEVHGKLATINPGPPAVNNLPAVQLAALKYKVVGPDHAAMDEGLLLLMQMQGGPNWVQPGPISDVSGHWMGDYQSGVGPGGGCIGMDLKGVYQPPPNGDFAPTLTSAFGGSMHMDHVYVPAVQSFFDVFFDVQGTVGSPVAAPDGPPIAPIALIGMSPPPNGDRPGIIAILIGLLLPPPTGDRPPTISGGYALYGSFFDVFTEVWTGKMHSFDMGSAHLMFEPNNG